MSEGRRLPENRRAFLAFVEVTTRWSDNDVYGHLNNVVYYSFFDTAINQYLTESGALDIENGQTIGLVAETGCTYISPVRFPQRVEAGIRVSHIGRTSVRYEVGIFLKDQPATSAIGHFVHVYVDRNSRKPVPLPPHISRVVEKIVSKQ